MATVGTIFRRIPGAWPWHLLISSFFFQGFLSPLLSSFQTGWDARSWRPVDSLSSAPLYLLIQ